MIKEIKYAVKIQFADHTRNPSRIFQSMADLIDSFKSIDTMLVGSINSDIKYDVFLEKVEVSSLVSRLKESITIPDQTNLGEENIDSVEDFLGESKEVIIDTIGKYKEINNAKIIREVQERINTVAENTGVSKVVTYSKIDKIKISSNISKLSKAANVLTEGDSAYYGKDEPNLQIHSTCNVDIDAIIEDLSNSVLDEDSVLILKIKKADLLGNSKWIFKHDDRTIEANIFHADWLEIFHSGSIPIASGDAMKVRLLAKHKYDTNGNVLSSQYEISEVIDVIHRRENEQLEVLNEKRN